MRYFDKWETYRRALEALQEMAKGVCKRYTEGQNECGDQCTQVSGVQGQFQRNK